MKSEKNSGIHVDLNPDATAEQIAEWEKMIEELKKKKGDDANDSTDK